MQLLYLILYPHQQELEESRCEEPVSLPISVRHLTHLTTPLTLADRFPLPSDLDWSQFQTHITLPSYLDYMMRMNKLLSIYSLLGYLEQLGLGDHSFRGSRMPHVYALIERRSEGGGGLIKHLCSLLTNGGMKSSELDCLTLLFMTVCGFELKRTRGWPLESNRRMVTEVWLDVEEGIEQARRSRRARDLMVEEDALEVFYLSLNGL